MRDRHEARLCRECRAPLARQSESCWRCGTSADPGAAREPRRSLADSTVHVLRTRARRADRLRRDQPPATHTPATKAGE